METDSLRFQTEGLRKRNHTHNIVLLCLIILNVITFWIMIFFNVAAGQNFGIFTRKTGDISDGNEVYITPAGATFSTWGAIYTWQALWLLLNVVLIFLKNENSRLYYDPPVLTILFHCFIFFNFCFNAGWLGLWDSQEFTGSFIFILFMAATVYAAIVISHRNIYNADQYLKRRWVLWLYRILVNNGLCFYAAWLTIATLLNLAIAITYRWAPEDQISSFRNTSSIISLSILAALLLVYFLFDILIFEKFLRYTWSTYIQLLIAFAGILGKNYYRKDAASTLALVLAIIVGIMFIAKITVTIVRHICCKKQNSKVEAEKV